MQHLVAFGILLETIYLFLASASDFRANLLPFFALSLSAALLAFPFARRAGVRSALFWAAVFRLTLLFRAPDLSEDLHRYAWDGHVAASGTSPYAHAPDNPHLASLRNDDWAKTAHRDAITIYPPAAQAIFRAAARTGNPRLALKIVFTMADLSIVWLLSRFDGGLFSAALYAAFPLPVFESAGMGHLDALGIALLLGALLYLRRARPARAGVAAALSAMIKYFSLFAILPFARRGRLRFAIPCALTIAALWLWGSAGGATPAAGLPNFATRWAGNSIVYPALETAVERARLAPRAKNAYAHWKSKRPEKPWMEKPWPFFYPEFFTRLLLALWLAAGLAVIAWKIADPVRASGASIALLLLLSPVLHPWYLLWVFPFAALFRHAAFLYLSAAIIFGYALSYPVAPFAPGVVLVLEYAPFAYLLWRDAADESRRSREGEGG